MFELFFVKSYLWPKKKQLSVALIGLLSLFVISTVVWLLLLFLSITEGIEKTWLSKLTSLNAPIRITPTETYYNSYYYQIDSISRASNYSLKTIREKLSAQKTDPYDSSTDEEIPSYWPLKEIDELDPIKKIFSSLHSLSFKFSDLTAEDYEVAGALMRLELIRPHTRNFQSFLSQVSYIATYPSAPSHLEDLIQKPTLRDLKHLIYLSSLYEETNLLERILANVTCASKNAPTIENILTEEISFKTEFDSPPTLSPPWAYFVEKKLQLPENGIILPRQFRDSDVLLGDRGFFSYQATTLLSSQEQRLPVHVVGFYDPGVISIGARFILSDPSLVHTMNVNCQTTAIAPLLTNGIQVWFKDYKKTDRVREILSKEFEKEGISQYFDIVPYYEYEFAKELIGQFQSDRYLFMLVGVLILTVACSNIISLLLLLVNDKKHEIGILLSLGATKKSIAFIFGGIGVTVGFISSLIGVSLAYFTLSHIDLFVNLLSTIEGRDAFNPLFYGDSLPNVMSLKALLFVLVASPLLSFFAGLIPAIKACKLKPSAILRSE
ncbi:MAG: ABC transporter permease [Chlamydiae bacterium]|nr:ABC transporter permease [Chlamydiota bacterium]